MDAYKVPNSVLLHWAIATFIAFLVASRGYRKQSLSATGAAAAFVVGSIGLGTDHRASQQACKDILLT
jgi:hypothetical protein